MSIPSWWQFTLLAVAAWRVFELAANDDVTERPRRWLLRLGEAYLDEKGAWKDVPVDYRLRLAKWLICPYCAGFWIGFAWWSAWQIWPHATVVVAVPFALNAVVIGLAQILSK